MCLIVGFCGQYLFFYIFFFFFNDTATTEIYTLSLHDALPISRAKGAPVDSQLMNPVPSAAGTRIIPKRVRHPHAALLLVDFILSRQGQQILADADYFPARSDVPAKDALASVIPARAGVPELFLSPDRLDRYTESSQKIFQELFQ